MNADYSLAARFWAKVEKTESCWLWMARVNNHGYGEINPGQRSGPPRLAHRLSYELIVGPIPEGFVLDHLCRTPRCVNPAHLEPVTHAENVRRGLSAQLKSQCPRGHALRAPNLYSPRAASERVAHAL